MFDTMTLTKIVGGVCGALLIFLMGKWAAEGLYHTGGGHGGESHAAYVIDTGADDDAGPAPVVDFATLLASADVGKGKKVFGKCKACHKIDGSNGTGPHLDGVVDRGINAVDGYGYSGALAQLGDTWTVDALNIFIENPKGSARGTTMGFAGLKKPEDRANLIAYLQSLNN